jgi:23S rRNA (uracil747-C5)-methyltransferase
MSFCSYFLQGACRSCSLIESPYDAQILQKEKQLLEMIQIPLEESIKSIPQHFRQKIKISVSGSLDHPILGLAQLEGSIEIHECPIQSKELNQTLPELYEFIKKYKITPYSIQERKGELKSLIISFSPQTQQYMLRFVLRSKESLDRIRIGLDDLKKFHVISINLQPIPHAILEGDEEIILTKNLFLTHQYDHLQVFYGPKSFMQTNLSVAQDLYASAVRWTQDLAITKIADLYCGSGAFGLHMAQAKREIIGFEVSAEAVLLASKAAQKQNLNAHFENAASEAIMDELENFAPDLVVVNPPRRGLGDSLKGLMRIKPLYLLYSSCSPESFKKDLVTITQTYKPLRCQLFDMFPHTHHFESLTLFRRI